MTLTPNSNINAQNQKISVDAKTGAPVRPVESHHAGSETKPAPDSAVGVSISEGLRARLAEASQTVRSVEEATDSLQAAEGSLGEASRILLQLRDVAVEATELMGDEERTTLSNQFDAGRKALEVIAETMANEGETPTAAEPEPVDLSALARLEDEARQAIRPLEEADDTGSTSARVDSRDSARAAVRYIDAAIEATDAERHHIDGLQRQLESALSTPETAFADLQSSESTISDADVAREVTESSRAQILQRTTSDKPVNAVDANRLGLQLF